MVEKRISEIVVRLKEIFCGEKGKDKIMKNYRR